MARLLSDTGIRVVVAGTAQESPLVAQVAGPARAAVAVAGLLDVPALAAVVADATVVVCNNSGGAHLASALGTPVVVLFAGTEQVEQYRPRFGPADVLTVPTRCSPCRQFACPYSLECLDLRPEEIASAALSLATPVRTAP